VRLRQGWPQNRTRVLSVGSGLLVALILLASITAQAGTPTAFSRSPSSETGSGIPFAEGQAHWLPMTSGQVSQPADGPTAGPDFSGPQTMVIYVGGAPWGETYDPANARLFVANGMGTNFSVISTVTNQVIAVVGTPYEYGWPVYDSADGFVYLGDAVINASTYEIVTNVSGPQYTEAYDPANQDVYEADPGLNNVVVINGEAVVGTIPVGQYPYGMGYDSANRDLYVANEGSSSLSVINSSTNQVTGTISSVQPGPAVVEDTANGNMFVGGNEGFGRTNVTVVSGATNRVVATVLTGNGSGGEAYDPVTGDIYVTQRYDTTADVQNVTVINGTTDKIVGSLITQQGPIGVTYSDFNHELYAADSDTGNVSLLLPLHSIAFRETGLQAGIPWTVTLNNQSLGSSTSVVSFTGADGPYQYTVHPIRNYTLSPSSANFTVVGTNVSIEISFSNGTLKSPPSTTYLGLTASEWWLALGVLVIIVGVAVFVLSRPKRRAGPPSNPVPKEGVTGDEH
jgi:YVTN family beta-propeller protein